MTTLLCYGEHPCANIIKPSMSQQVLKTISFLRILLFFKGKCFSFLLFSIPSLAPQWTPMQKNNNNKQKPKSDT